MIFPTIQRSGCFNAIRPGARKSNGASNGRLVPTSGTNPPCRRARQGGNFVGGLERQKVEKRWPMTWSLSGNVSRRWSNFCAP